MKISTSLDINELVLNPTLRNVRVHVKTSISTRTNIRIDEVSLVPYSNCLYASTLV